MTTSKDIRIALQTGLQELDHKQYRAWDIAAFLNECGCDAEITGSITTIPAYISTSAWKFYKTVIIELKAEPDLITNLIQGLNDTLQKIDTHKLISSSSSAPPTFFQKLFINLAPTQRILADLAQEFHLGRTGFDVFTVFYRLQDGQIQVVQIVDDDQLKNNMRPKIRIDLNKKPPIKIDWKNIDSGVRRELIGILLISLFFIVGAITDRPHIGQEYTYVGRYLGSRTVLIENKQDLIDASLNWFCTCSIGLALIFSFAYRTWHDKKTSDYKVGVILSILGFLLAGFLNRHYPSIAAALAMTAYYFYADARLLQALKNFKGKKTEKRHIRGCWLLICLNFGVLFLMYAMALHLID